MFEDVDARSVARAALDLGPQLVLRKADLVEDLLGQTVCSVRARLRVRERSVDALHPPTLALDVAGGAVVAFVPPGRYPDSIAGPVLRHASFASTSPGSSTPFSMRIVSTE